MKLMKRIIIVIAVLFLIGQFFRPSKNTLAEPSSTDISLTLVVPREVDAVFRSSCYDCHSNNTRYPWYAEVQPVGWFLSNDIKDGKKQLNFSEFATYPARRQYIKLNDIIEQLSEEKMPLPAYLLMHSDARLSQEQRDLVIRWAHLAQDSIRARYPADSLKRH